MTQDTTPRPIACQYRLIAGKPTEQCKSIAVYSQPRNAANYLLCDYHMTRIGYASAKLTERLANKRVVVTKIVPTNFHTIDKDKYDFQIKQLKREIFQLKHKLDCIEEKAEGRRNPVLDGVVYMIRPSNGGYVKIGWTSNLEKRMKDYAPDTAVLGVMPGTRKDEHRLHKRFAHLRTHGREWYPLAPQILEEARRMVSLHGDPPVVDFAARESKTPFMRPVKRTA